MMFLARDERDRGLEAFLDVALGEINGQKVFGALLPAPRPKGEGFRF
jgi:hypothetical protein